MPELPSHPFTIRDLPDLGLSYRDVYRAVQRGELRRATTGVYVDAELPDTTTLRAECARLILKPNQVVSDQSAAWIHGIDVYARSPEQTPPRLTTVGIDGANRLRRGDVLGGRRSLLPEDVCEVGGVLVTTPARTVCDLASLRGRRTALATIDSFLHEELVTKGDLHRLLPRYKGRRGVTQLRELVELADAGSESTGESWTRLELLDRGLPVPEVQVWVNDLSGFGDVRLDLAYELPKVAVEYDGKDFHTKPEQRRHDRERRDALRALGWTIIVVTKDDFTEERIDAWIGQVRAALAFAPMPGKRVWARGPSPRT